PEERHAQGRNAHSPRGSQSRVGASQSAHALVTDRSDGVAPVEDGKDKKQRGVPRVDGQRPVAGPRVNAWSRPDGGVKASYAAHFSPHKTVCGCSVTEHITKPIPVNEIVRFSWPFTDFPCFKNRTRRENRDRPPNL